MNKAFIFDLDGVLIDNEPIWNTAKQQIYHDLFGEEVITKMGSTVGINMDGIYNLALKNGSKVPKKVFLNAFFEKAHNIYSTAPLTSGIEALVDTLHKNNFKIGIVSASPREWIDLVTKRIKNSDKISLIVSLYDRKDLPHKPAPDGYLEAMRLLDAEPKSTLVLEDSNTGIKSAKSAGAYTIGLKENLVKGYDQKGADWYANNLAEVEKKVKKNDFD